MGSIEAPLVFCHFKMALGSTAQPLTSIGWPELPKELLLRVLDELRWTRRNSRSVRRVCRRWRAIHDSNRRCMRVRDGVPDQVICTLCGRLPALTDLSLLGVTSLSNEGVRAVCGLLPTLTRLDLGACCGVTDVGVRELRALTTLKELSLTRAVSVTDVGLRELRGLTALRRLFVIHCCTTKAGRDALKAALPALTIHA